MIKPRECVEKMKGYFVPMFENHWDVKIDGNENNYGASPKVINAIRHCDVDNISYYPFYGKLSQKLADIYKVSIDNIKVTNGADEAIQGIIQAYLDKDDALLTLDVSFEMPVIYAQIQNSSVIKVPFQKKWDFPIDDFLKALDNDKIKIVYIASPNNPTGNIIKESDLVKILKKAQDKVIIIDETYANYIDTTYKKFIRENDNLFIVRSFSKDYALAGLRLGYIISNSENIKNVKKVISPFSVNALAIKAGIIALDELDFFEKVKFEINQTKKEMTKFFESFGFTVYPSNANFLLIDCGKKAGFIHNQLRKESISVKLFKEDSLLNGHLRVTIPTEQGFLNVKNALRTKPSLVFDMDGVLINAKSYRETILKVFEQCTGKKISHEEVQKIKNQGGMNNDWDLTMFLLKREGVNVSYDELVECFQKIYWNNGKGLINIEEPLFDRKLLEELSKDYNLSIFTGRLKKEAIFAINRFNILDLFSPIITTDDVSLEKSKPDPTGLNIIKNITISDKYYYFGDTLDDIQCAKSAGYIAIGVLPPQDKSEELKNLMKEKGADEVINSVFDIPELLGKIYERVH